ncbi:hypothetical protein [Bacteroides xylanisolvens]|uniref:hypothetical protein n=1 Tax=Bacteroides xylanisolvens TaxID=371601 RepID=UPI001CE4A156|nr:hypothetical protein [Bacteroides xylanisolvens]
MRTKFSLSRTGIGKCFRRILRKRPEHGEEYRGSCSGWVKPLQSGCSKGDVRKVLMIENIAMDDSPIWQLMDELKASGGRYRSPERCCPPVGTGEDGAHAMMEEHTMR